MQNTARGRFFEIAISSFFCVIPLCQYKLMQNAARWRLFWDSNFVVLHCNLVNWQKLQEWSWGKKFSIVKLIPMKIRLKSESNFGRNFRRGMTLTLKSFAYLLIFGDQAASNALTSTLLFDIFRYFYFSNYFKCFGNNFVVFYCILPQPKVLLQT